MRMAWVCFGLSIFGLCCLAPGCGPDTRRLQADETVRLASSALVDIGTTGSESPALRDALSHAHADLEETEHALDLWESAGSLAYQTTAPCLAHSLGLLRNALIALEREVPETLEQAEAQALDAAARPCARARRARAAEPPSEEGPAEPDAQSEETPSPAEAP